MNYELLMYLVIISDNPLFIVQAWNTVARTNDLNLIQTLYFKYKDKIVQSFLKLNNEEKASCSEPVDPDWLLINIIDSLGLSSTTSKRGAEMDKT